MITYNVTLFPLPEISIETINNLLKDINQLSDSLPGLLRVDVFPYHPTQRQETYTYTMLFDTEEHLHAYNTHLLYQSLSESLSQISPRSVVSRLKLQKPELGMYENDQV